jgi:hypothetical protein
LALLNLEKFNTSLILDQNNSINKANSQYLTVGWPVTGATLGRNFLFVHVSLISLPETKVNSWATGQILQNRVKWKALNLVVMTVLEESLTSSRPNNDAIVSTTSGELLSIFLISNAIYGITMTANLFQTFTGNRIVYKHTVSHCHQQLCAVYYNYIIWYYYQAWSKRPKLCWSC